MTRKTEREKCYEYQSVHVYERKRLCVSAFAWQENKINNHFLSISAITSRKSFLCAVFIDSDCFRLCRLWIIRILFKANSLPLFLSSKSNQQRRRENAYADKWAPFISASENNTWKTKTHRQIVVNLSQNLLEMMSTFISLCVFV